MLNSERQISISYKGFLATYATDLARTVCDLWAGCGKKWKNKLTKAIFGFDRLTRFFSTCWSKTRDSYT
jgi:hypothetical protein